jgi:hypothetical protein
LETWSYSDSHVEFSFSSGKVIYWENNDGTLKVKGIRPDITEEEARKSRRNELRAEQESNGRKFAFGCVGTIVAGIAVLVLLASVCG